jgi:hypothetical protein
MIVVFIPALAVYNAAEIPAGPFPIITTFDIMDRLSFLL